jgi:hypothetical protein
VSLQRCRSVTASRGVTRRTRALLARRTGALRDASNGGAGRVGASHSER